MINLEAWLNGLYVHHAVGALFDKKAKYFDKPISLQENNVDENIEKKMADKFSAYATVFNYNFKKNQRREIDE